MKDKTLREVCELCGVSRRAVQGYEKCGLVKATGKTLRGYLLYDKDAQDRIMFVKKLQYFGFSLKEVKSYLCEMTPAKQKNALIGKLANLREQEKQLIDFILSDDTLWNFPGESEEEKRLWAWMKEVAKNGLGPIK